MSQLTGKVSLQALVAMIEDMSANRPIASMQPPVPKGGAPTAYGAQGAYGAPTQGQGYGANAQGQGYGANQGYAPPVYGQRTENTPQYGSNAQPGYGSNASNAVYGQPPAGGNYNPQAAQHAGQYL